MAAPMVIALVVYLVAMMEWLLDVNLVGMWGYKRVDYLVWMLADELVVC